MSSSEIQTLPIICSGGLESTGNHLLLSRQAPGVATRLINYEPSQTGGYRKINGYTKFDDDYYNVDDTNCEGAILGLVIYTKSDGTYEYFAARKLKSGAEYKWYKFSSGVGWVQEATGITHSHSSSLKRIRTAEVNWDGTPVLCIVDGVNKAVLYNGTSWVEVDSTNTGANFANAGGPQVIDDPHYVTEYENHLFFARSDGSGKHIVCHSAPEAAYDWTSGNGAGQIFAGFDVAQIKPFRDKLYVFGRQEIKRISVDSTTFVIKDVTKNVGCVASDSVLEIGSRLVFLAADGFRPIEGTDRIDDIGIAPISYQIRTVTNRVISNYDEVDFHGVVIKNKAQLRYFYGGSGSDEGIVGGYRYQLDSEASGIEWGILSGISPSICFSKIVDGEEKVIFGDHTGNVFTMESGSSFDGANILSVYSTPYLDAGTPSIYKGMKRVTFLLAPEGQETFYIGTKFDWSDPDINLPADFTSDVGGAPVVYGGIGVKYDQGFKYGTSNKPWITQPLEGGGFSFRLTFVSNSTNSPHTIQSMFIDYSIKGQN